MTAAGSGAVHCPSCGEVVRFDIVVRTVTVDRGHLWVHLYDPKPDHKCPRDKEPQ